MPSVAMSAQKHFASVPYDTTRKVTRRETFPGEMDHAMPWARIMPLIEPH